MQDPAKDKMHIHNYVQEVVPVLLKLFENSYIKNLLFVLYAA